MTAVETNQSKPPCKRIDSKKKKKLLEKSIGKMS